MPKTIIKEYSIIIDFIEELDKKIDEYLKLIKTGYSETEKRSAKIKEILAAISFFISSYQNNIIRKKLEFPELKTTLGKIEEICNSITIINKNKDDISFNKINQIESQLKILKRALNQLKINIIQFI